MPTDATPDAAGAESAADTLARLRAENAALRESEALLRVTQRIASVGSWTWDLETGRVRWSDEMYRIYGVAREDFDGTVESAARMFHPDDRERAADGVRRVLTEEGYQGSGGVYRVLRPDGEVRWVWGEGEVQRDPEGRRVMLGTISDVTELWKTQQALRSSEQRLRLALSAARMGTWEWDLADELVWSEEMFAMHGLPADADPPIGEAYYACIHPADRERVHRTAAEALADPTKGDDYRVEYRTLLPGGEVAWLFGKGRVLRDEEGRPLRMAGVALDVSAQRRLEAELQHKRRMESLGRLAGGIAHDFNNLLTAILGASELARDDLDDRPRLEQNLAAVSEAASRAGELTAQLLAFARRSRIERRTLDLNECVRSVERLLRRVLGEDVVLATRLHGELWPVEGDVAQVQQVLLNLALNAREAMPSGGTLHVETENVPRGRLPSVPSLPAGDYVVVRVRDEGVGMSEEVLQHVFEPFYTTKDEGNGLGLASSLGTVEQLGGTIRVTSAPGQGSEFRVYLPRGEGAPEDGEAERSEGTPSGRESVLVVEDEPLLREMVAAHLSARGFQVLRAGDGEEALAVVEAHAAPLDALVTDVVMPRLGGIELARRLRDERPELAVLLISGYAEDLASDAPLPPRTAFLPKPFPPSRCVRALRALLDGEPTVPATRV